MHFAQGLSPATGLESHLPVEVGIAVNVPQIRECADYGCFTNTRSTDKYNRVLGRAQAIRGSFERLPARTNLLHKRVFQFRITL
jgi:hypothetical protein